MRFGMGLFFGNYDDWDRFEAAERGEDVGPPLTDEQVWHDQMAIADLAEPLGFSTLWSFEQHGSPYLMIPDPHQFLSYFAARTKTLDVGSMIAVLPWHNPVRLAEQISMLQHHLGRDRKYYMGVGRGLARRNFEAMGVEMETSRERFNEVYEILRLALTQEFFSYDGKFFQYENVSVRPRPIDPSVITDAWGTWTSEPSKRLMAQRGMHPMTTPNATFESYMQDLEDFNRIRGEHGFGPAERPILQVPLLCCETHDEAQEAMEELAPKYVASINRQYEIGTERFANQKGYEDYTGKSGQSDYGDGTAEGAQKTLTAKFMREGVWGSPEECAEKVAAHLESVHPSELVLLSAIGSMTAAQAEKSFRLFAGKVIPRFADWTSDLAVAR